MKKDIINSNCIIFNADSYKLLENSIKLEENGVIDKEHNVDLILMDPPYDIPTMHKDKTTNNKFSQARNKKLEEIQDFINGIDFKIFDYFKQIQKKTNIIIFCNKKLLIDLIRFFEGKDLLLEILVWHKTNAIPLTNNTFISDIEYILYIRDRGVKLQGDYSVRKKVFQTATNIKDKSKYKHPTIKPVEILNNLIQVSTKENDIILDAFMGSGSTGVACKRTKRKFIGIEKDPKYYEIAKKRLTEEYKATTIFDIMEQS